MLKLTHLISLTLLIALSGCASGPSHVILAPQISQPATAIYQGQSVALAVTDLRANSHIIQILKKDQPATLYSASQLLEQTLATNLTQYLNGQGLATDGGNITIDVAIDKALVSVQQELMKYQANSDIQLTVTISNGQQTLTNTVKSKGASNGPLSADIAVLERDLNQQLGKIISDIANNDKMITFIRK